MSQALPREWFGASIRNDSVRREKARLRARSVILYLAAVLLPLSALLFLILQGVQVIRTGYEIDGLKDRLQVLQAEKDRLEVELATLGSLETIEALAARDLGMVRPGPGQVVTVRITASGPAEAVSTEERDGEGPPERGFLALLRKVTRAL